MPNKKTGGYTYRQLKDLESGDKNYFFAVVKRVEKKNSSSANPQLSIWLTDPSIGFDDALRADVYGATNVDSIEQGDIIRMHRASFGGDKLISGVVGRLGFQFLLWSGKPGSSMQPKSTSSNFTHVENDNNAVRELRIWIQENLDKQKLDDPALKLTDDLCDFSYPGDYRTIVVQIIGIFLTNRNSTVIRVWDGTRITDGKILKARALDLTKIDLASEVTVTHSYDKDLDDRTKDYSVDIFVYDEHVEVAKSLKTSAPIKYKRGIWKMNLDDASVLRLKKKLEDIIGPIKSNAVDEEPALDDASCSNYDSRLAPTEVPNTNFQNSYPDSSSSFRSIIEGVDSTAYEKIRQIAENISKAKRGIDEANGTVSPSKKMSLRSSLSKCSVESTQLNLTNREKQFLSDYAYLLTNKDALSSSFEEEVYSTPEESVMYSQDPIVVVKQCSSPGRYRLADREQQTSQPLSDSNTNGSANGTIVADSDFSPVAASTQKDYFSVAPRRSLRSNSNVDNVND